MSELPILYSFRRCPFAIRARLAIVASGQRVELREIVLRDKAPEFLKTSPSATVPCLKLGKTVLDESLDIMIWALRRNDPEAWLHPQDGDLDAVMALIRECDGPFKRHLDRYKYDTRYADADKITERTAGAQFLWQLDDRLGAAVGLFGSRLCLADYAILPFVRQFANSGRIWFDTQRWESLKRWLVSFENSDGFAFVMGKFAKWRADRPLVLFPDYG